MGARGHAPEPHYRKGSFVKTSSFSRWERAGVRVVAHCEPAQYPVVFQTIRSGVVVPILLLVTRPTWIKLILWFERRSPRLHIGQARPAANTSLAGETMAVPLRWFRRLVFGIPPRDWYFVLYGLSEADPAKCQHLERIGCTVMDGYHVALDDSRPQWLDPG